MGEVSRVVRAQAVSQCLNLHTCSDWMTDPSLPKKLEIFQLFDGAFAHGSPMHCASVPIQSQWGSVNGRRQWARGALPPSVDGSHLLFLGRSRNALWVCPSIRLRGLRQKVEKCSTDPSANQIVVMQMHSTLFLDPFCNNKQEEAGKIRPLYILQELWNNRIVFSHLLFVSSFVFLSTHRLCSRKRFDWLQYASTDTSPYTSDTPSFIRRRTHVVCTM